MKLKIFIFVLFVANVKAMMMMGMTNMFGPGFPFNNDFGAQMRQNMEAQMTSMRQNMDNMMQQMNRHQIIMGDIMGRQFYESMDNLHRQMDNMNAKFEATRLISSMLRGTGGSTWIAYNGNNVIVRSNHLTGCQGQVLQTPNGYQCGGAIVKVNDICVPGSKSYSQLNDKFCVFDDSAGSHNAYVSNGQVVCENGYLYTQQELQRQCGPNILGENYAHVKYMPNLSDPQHVPIPENNPYLRCGATNSCEFDSNFSGFKSFF